MSRPSKELIDKNKEVLFITVGALSAVKYFLDGNGRNNSKISSLALSGTKQDPYLFSVFILHKYKKHLINALCPFTTNDKN